MARTDPEAAGAFRKWVYLYISPCMTERGQTPPIVSKSLVAFIEAYSDTHTQGRAPSKIWLSPAPQRPTSTALHKPSDRSTSASANSSTSRYSSPLITINVGPELVPFHLHEVLCFESHYLRAACSHSWLPKNRTLNLPDDSPDVFEKLLDWLYTREVRKILEKYPDDTVADYAPDTVIVTSHLLLYILADKLQLPNLITQLDPLFIKQLKEDHQHWDASLVSEGELLYIYDNTYIGSRLRTHATRAVAREIASNYYSIEYYRESTISRPDFAVDLAIALGYRFSNSRAFGRHKM
ncbi:hypothetical protein MMC18_002354 [Xylographa bjoerkii]|nr:hypothetical protein [Xylographa bjoerkii]